LSFDDDLSLTFGNFLAMGERVPFLFGVLVFGYNIKTFNGPGGHRNKVDGYGYKQAKHCKFH